MAFSKSSNPVYLYLGVSGGRSSRNLRLSSSILFFFSSVVVGISSGEEGGECSGVVAAIAFEAGSPGIDSWKSNASIISNTV